MNFLLATTEQKEQLEGLYNNRSEIQFFKYEEQWLTPSTNLYNADFIEILNDLHNLPTIELLL